LTYSKELVDRGNYRSYKRFLTFAKERGLAHGEA
jgi:hypothetical protein